MLPKNMVVPSFHRIQGQTIMFAIFAIGPFAPDEPLFQILLIAMLADVFFECFEIVQLCRTCVPAALVDPIRRRRWLLYPGFRH